MYNFKILKSKRHGNTKEREGNVERHNYQWNINHAVEEMNKAKITLFEDNNKTDKFLKSPVKRRRKWSVTVVYRHER